MAISYGEKLLNPDWMMYGPARHALAAKPKYLCAPEEWAARCERRGIRHLFDKKNPLMRLADKEGASKGLYFGMIIALTKLLVSEYILLIYGITKIPLAQLAVCAIISNVRVWF